MNSDLIEYGILQEFSDIRVHVSVSNKSVYVFQTLRAIDAIARTNPPIVTAKQKNTDNVTAAGWLVKIKDIYGCKQVFYHGFKWENFRPSMSTSEKGKLSAKCVLGLLELGKIPIHIIAKECDDTKLQLKGVDILLDIQKRIQVKCDWDAGKTGNLFLQKAECNPFKLI